MERKQVVEILMFYRNIDGEIRLIKKMVQDYEDAHYTSSGSSLQESCINSRNKISRPTETIALNVPECASAAMHKLQKEIAKLTTLQVEIIQEVHKLPTYQKSIIYHFYLKGLQWVQITHIVPYSKEQCKRIRNKGLDNLAKSFAKNAAIKNFNHPL